MAREESAHGEDAEGARTDLRAILKELAIALAIVGIIFAAIFGYTQVYPPLVVVESSSMQHSDDTSYVGVIDTGDLVLVQAARVRPDVVTWIEGRVTGHETYGDYGDVIVFRKPGALQDATPVIHRAIMYVIPNGTDAYDIPDLRAFPSLQWEGVGRGGAPVQGNPVALQQVTIHGLGWRHDLGVTFELVAFTQNPITRGMAGFITMGDNNAYNSCFASRDPCEPFKPYDQSWIVPVENVIGRARGEIPWFGLLKLTFQPSLVRILGAIAGVVVGVMLPRTNRNVILVVAAIAGGLAGYFVAGLFDAPPLPAVGCCTGWGDPAAPKNSWDSLLLAMPLVFGSPLIAEGALWAWKRYVSPRLARGRKASAEAASDGAGDEPSEPR